MFKDSQIYEVSFSTNGIRLSIILDNIHAKNIVFDKHLSYDQFQQDLYEASIDMCIEDLKKILTVYGVIDSKKNKLYWNDNYIELFKKYKANPDNYYYFSGV